MCSSFNWRSGCGQGSFKSLGQASGCASKISGGTAGVIDIFSSGRSGRCLNIYESTAEGWLQTYGVGSANSMGDFDIEGDLLVATPDLIEVSVPGVHLRTNGTWAG